MSEKKEKTQELTWDIQGEGITDFVREQFFTGRRTYEDTIRVLRGFMVDDHTSPEQIRRYAEDILLGRAALKGSTREGTYGLTLYDPEEEEKLPDSMNVWKLIDERNKAEKELKLMEQRLYLGMRYLSERQQREIREEMGEETEEDRKEKRQEQMLSSYMERMNSKKKHTTEDYGWLSPDGRFFGVEWGDHQNWAQEYIEKYFPELTDDPEIDMQTKMMSPGLIGAGDWLVEHGWVLLHNPMQGLAYPTSNPARKMTKQQKEFLYTYYIERNHSKEANEVWKEGQ